MEQRTNVKFKDNLEKSVTEFLNTIPKVNDIGNELYVVFLITGSFNADEHSLLTMKLVYVAFRMAETLQRWKNISREYRFTSLRTAISRSLESCVSTFEVPVSLSFRKQLSSSHISEHIHVCGYCRSSTQIYTLNRCFIFLFLMQPHTHTHTCSQKIQLKNSYC